MTFAAGPAAVLSNLCRATATTALQLASNRPAAAGPSPPSALSEGPSRHVQLKNNFATPSCAILLQNFFGTKSTHHLAGTSPTVRGRERGARWLARIVGKQVRSWSNWHGLHQLGGGRQGSGYYCRQKAKKRLSRLAPRFGSKQLRSRQDLGVKASGD